MLSVLLNLAAKNVMRKKERSILTIIGVLLAVAATITLVSLSEGLYLRIREEVDNRDVDIYVNPRTAVPLPMGPIGPMGVTTDTIPPQIVLQLKQVPDVADVAPITRVLVNFHGTVVVLWGFDPTKLNLFFPYLRLRSGEPYESDAPTLVAGDAIARAFHLTVGSPFRIGEDLFTVVGVAGKTGGFQDYFCYLSLTEAMRIQKAPGYQEVWMRVTDPSRTKEVKDKIKGLFPALVPRTREEFLGVSLNFVRLAKLLQFAIASIGILIAMTAATNTMLMSAYERMREFGSLRAIGASRGFIFGLIFLESSFLSLLGGVGGVFFGVLGSLLFNEAVVTLFQLSFPLSALSPSLILQGLLVSVIVGAFGGSIPAFAVTNMGVIQSLRWE